MQDRTTGVRGAVLCKGEKKIYLDSLLKHPTTVGKPRYAPVYHYHYDDVIFNGIQRKIS